MTTITRDEWLAELERVMAARDPKAYGLTSDELAVQWGCCKRVALDRLKMLGDRLTVGYKRGTSISGRNTMVPCYRLKTEVKRAAKRR